MQNQINIGDQNTQQIGQNPVGQLIKTLERVKANLLIIWLVIFVGFVIFGVGGYYLGRKSLESPQPISEIQTKLTQTPSTTPAPFADWKTYTNDKFAFEIKYPQDWTANAEGPNAAMLQIQSGQQISGTVQPRYDTINFSDKNNKKQFEIAIFNPDNSPFPTSTQGFKDGYLYINGGCDLRWGFIPNSVAIVKIDNSSFLQVRGNRQIEGSNLNTVCYYGKTKQGNLIVLSAWADSFSNNLSLFDQILSTFKFLGSSKGTIIIKLYYHDAKLDPKGDFCEANNYIEKEIQKTNTPIKDAINTLISSNVIEKDDRFFLKSINLKQDGTLILEFPWIGGFTTGGSCRIGVLTSQIEKTALQFPEVKNVLFNPEVFQP